MVTGNIEFKGGCDGHNPPGFATPKKPGINRVKRKMFSSYARANITIFKTEKGEKDHYTPNFSLPISGELQKTKTKYIQGYVIKWINYL